MSYYRTAFNSIKKQKQIVNIGLKLVSRNLLSLLKTRNDVLSRGRSTVVVRVAVATNSIKIRFLFVFTVH